MTFRGASVRQIAFRCDGAIRELEEHYKRASRLEQSMSNVEPPLDLWKWVEANRNSFAPPVGNKVIWRDSEFIAMVVHGPNRRRDFHVDPHDELFFQLRGDIHVVIVNPDRTIVRHDVCEGQLFLVPAFTPHSPRRPAGTWGLVVELKRTADETEELLWFCEGCGSELHKVSMKVADIEVQLAQAIRGFDSSVELRTCRRCGRAMPEQAEEPV
jgi:3-hydroxyanthranilate 3,4-dioxygenase